MFWSNGLGPPRERPGDRLPDDPIEPAGHVRFVYPPYSATCMWEYRGRYCGRTIRHLANVGEHVNRHIYRLPNNETNHCRWRNCPRINPFMDRHSLSIHVRDHMQVGAYPCFFRVNGCYLLFETIDIARIHARNCRQNYGVANILL